MVTCPSGHESASEDFCDVCGYLISAAPSFGPGQAGSAPSSAPGSAQAAATQAGVPTVVGPPPGAAGACPRCGAPRFGQFCEACGYDFANPAAAAPRPGLAPPAPPRSMPPGSVPPRPVPPRPVPPDPVPSEPVTSFPGGSAVGPPASGPPGAPGPPGPPGPPRAAAVGTQWTAVVTADHDYYDDVQAEGGPDAPGIAFPAYYPERRFRLSGTEVRVGRHSAHSGIDPEIDLAIPPADPGVSRLHAVLIRAADGTWSVVDPGSANGTLLNGTEIPCDQAVPLRDGDRIHLGAWTELRVIRDG
jgi:hypothetical protein